MLKSCPLLLTSIADFPTPDCSSVRQYTSDELTYCASDIPYIPPLPAPLLHRRLGDCTKCLPVTRSNTPLPTSLSASASSTPVTVGARSYTNCTPLDVRSAPLLLTSTDTVCSDPALGASHTILLDVSNRPSVITLSDPPPPSPDSANMHPSPDPALKPDPSTCTIVDPSTAPADGTIPDTTTGASYSKASSEPCDASCPFTTTCTRTSLPSQLELAAIPTAVTRHSILPSSITVPSTASVSPNMHVA